VKFGSPERSADGIRVPDELKDKRSKAQRERDRRNNLKSRDPAKRHRHV